MKKGQIHLTETVAVIFIFFVLVLFGLIFFFNFQTSAIKEKQKEFFNARAIDTATKTLFLPEFICSESGEVTVNCLDMMKIRRMIGEGGLFKEHEQLYFELFSFAKISIIQTYPGPFEEVLYEKAPAQIKNVKPTYFVVSLKDERIARNYHGFGYVLIEVYS
jgi:hypothetical protein